MTTPVQYETMALTALTDKRFEEARVYATLALRVAPVVVVPEPPAPGPFSVTQLSTEALIELIKEARAEIKKRE